MKYVSGVYIVGLKKQSRFSKVGVTSNIDRRLRSLSTGSPFEPFLHHMFELERFDTAYTLETKCHEKLASYRVNGEWFKLSPCDTYDKINSLFPDRSFKYRPINMPDTIDGLAEHVANSKRKTSALLIQDPQTACSQT